MSMRAACCLLSSAVQRLRCFKACNHELQHTAHLLVCSKLKIALSRIYCMLDAAVTHIQQFNNHQSISSASS